MKQISLPFLVVLFTLMACEPESNLSEQVLDRQTNSFWFDQAASVWTEAIPIGNGRLGAMVFGDPDEEQIVLNEVSIWEGPPVPAENKQGPELIEEIRELLFEGKLIEANDLCQNEFLSPRISPRAYQPLGFLHINDLIAGKASQYKRWLDYGTGIAHVTYSKNGTSFHREYLASHPEDMIIIRYTAEDKAMLSIEFSLDRPAGSKTQISGNEMHISGQAGHDGQHLGVIFDGLVRINHTGGSLLSTETGISIEAADEVLVYITASTNYNLDDPDQPLEHDRLSWCEQKLDKGASRSYKSLRSQHIDDYQSLFHRSVLDIAYENLINSPLDKRLEAARAGQNDPGLLLTYYEYCRYLLISGSRE